MARRARAAYDAADYGPGRARRAAAAVFLLVLLIPVIAVLVVAAVIAAAVFIALSIAQRAAAFMRGFLPKSDGRENVRVIHRSE
jgi:hypothetical protein